MADHFLLFSAFLNYLVCKYIYMFLYAEDFFSPSRVKIGRQKTHLSFRFCWTYVGYILDLFCRTYADYNHSINTVLTDASRNNEDHLESNR